MIEARIAIEAEAAALAAARRTPADLRMLFDAFLPRLRLAMIHAKDRSAGFGGRADHADHQALADAIATRNPSAAAESSRSHLTGLKEVFT